MHDLMVAALEKDADLVQQINGPLMGLHKNLFVESNPIPVKFAAWRAGLIASPFCRPPLAELDTKVSYMMLIERSLPIFTQLLYSFNSSLLQY